MTTLLRLTNFSGMIILETSLISIEDAITESADTESIFFKDACTKANYSNDTCIWAGTFSGGAYIRTTSIGAGCAVGAPIRGAHVESTCIQGT